MSRRGENQKPGDAWKAQAAEIARRKKRTAAANRLIAAKEAAEPQRLQERAQERMEAFREREEKRQRRRRDARARKRATSAWMRTAP